MPVVSVHTSFLISKTFLNELIGNLKAIFKTLLMICTILGFSLIVCNQVKNLHVLAIYLNPLENISQLHQLSIYGPIVKHA